MALKRTFGYGCMMRTWESTGAPAVHALPFNADSLASAAQRLPPIPGNPIAECLKPFPVAGNRVIVEVAVHDRPQPLPRRGNRIVHSLPQLLQDLLQLRAHPLAYRLPL